MEIFPTRCPICKRNMRKKQTLGFWECVEVVIEKICTSGTAPEYFGCKSMVKNPKYAKWQQLKKQYDKQMQERQKIIEENETKLIFKKKVPPMPKPVPPEPPKKIPCKNHYDKEAKGEFNENIVNRKNKQLFTSDGLGNALPVKKIF